MRKNLSKIIYSLKNIFIRNNIKPENTQKFGVLGLEYYICGRFSYFCEFSITGNLFHHAVEMFLKMELSRHISEDLLRVRYRHGLKRLWKEFKKLNSNINLAKHDKTIKELDKWEEIRYPSKKYRLLSQDLERSIPPTLKKKGSLPKRYEVVLVEFDELVKDIFQAISISPKRFGRVFIETAIGTEAKRIYELENRHRIMFY